MTNQKILSEPSKKQLLEILEVRFNKNQQRHDGIAWQTIVEKLNAHPEKLWCINEMEKTGGEPDVVLFNKDDKELYYVDCSKESPDGRRSLCYDRAALDARKTFKPENNAIDLATDMGAELLSENEYKFLQAIEPFDLKTSSWLLTPKEMRVKDGAIFGDNRFGRVFIYHNGVQSYYGGRGFRAKLKV